LGIWWLGLGYFLFYTPYSGLTKAMSNGLLPGMNGPVAGRVLLPASVIATVTCMLGFITSMGWWKYAGRREFFGISIPFPRRLTFLSGVCTAIIIGTTTLAFTFEGISIVLVLVLLRGGVLILAPLVDSIVARRVRWFSWAAMLISLLALAVVLGDAGNYKLTLAATADVAAYLAAYFFKFQFMTRLAKSDERNDTLRYFVEEQMIASPLLLLGLAGMAALGLGDLMMGFRVGFTTFLASPAAVWALLVGLFYAGLCVCTTFIFLDRRENTFCVPMHCGSSMLSGLAATFALTLLFNQNPASSPQLASAGLIVIALTFLSPLHHFRFYLFKLSGSAIKAYRLFANSILGVEGQDRTTTIRAQTILAEGISATAVSPADLNNFTRIRRVFLFVCSGNTCRSPMAAAIGNAEIAARLNIPFDNLLTAEVHALSAGVSARVGAPMTPEALQALRQLRIPTRSHSAVNLSADMVHQVEKIYCMTRAHRDAVIKMMPAVAAKTLCLDPDGDVDDPIGKGHKEYVDCALRIHDLVRLRFDELGLQSGF
jgi:protein-tyrosine-phosphatase